jgi:hypothetical protein
MRYVRPNKNKNQNQKPKNAPIKLKKRTKTQKINILKNSHDSDIGLQENLREHIAIE